MNLRIHVILITAIFIFFNSLSVGATTGDVNENGKLDMADAIIILQTLVGLRETKPPPLAEMVLIPAGSFQMGDAIDDMTFAKPVHTVSVDSFNMDKYEVTKALWDAVYIWAITHGYIFDNTGAATESNHPVHNVSWNDVVKWLNARSEKEGRTPVYYMDVVQETVYKRNQASLTNGMVKWTANGYRLPTEAEWEYAARAGTTTRYYTGDCISTDQANFNGNYTVSGCPPSHYRNEVLGVGSFAPNPWGLYDMAGNISEWVWDRYSNNYSAEAVTDPRGNDSGAYRVIRDQSWGGGADSMQSASRGWNNIDTAHISIGFRSVLSQQ